MKIVYTVTFDDGRTLDFLGRDGCDFRDVYSWAIAAMMEYNSQQRGKCRQFNSIKVMKIELKDYGKNSNVSALDKQLAEIDRMRFIWESLDN